MRTKLGKLIDFIKNFDVSYIYALLGEATLALTFVFYIMIARVLGPEQYGVFSAAVALGGILSLFIQFGLQVLLNRDVAENPTKGSESTLLYLGMQALNALPVLLILPLLCHLFDFDGYGIAVCYLVIFSEIFRSFKFLWRSVMKGHAWFKMETVSVAVERLFMVFFAGAALLWTKNIVWVVAIMATARLLDNIGIGWYLAKRVKLWSKEHRPSIYSIYRKALPFALHGMMWILYYQIDVIMLKAMAPVEEVGYYSAAYRVLEIFAALPRVVFYVAFTSFAQCYLKTPELLPKKLYEATRILLLLVLPCLIVAGFIQPVLIRWFFGEAYLGSIILLATLLPSLGIKLFGTLSEEFLLSTGREKYLPVLLTGVVLSNVLANLILIPRFGALGAAIATCFSECVFCVLSLALLIRLGHQSIGWRLIKLAIPCGVLALAPTLTVIGFSPLLSTALLIPSSLLVVYFMRKTF